VPRLPVFPLGTVLLPHAILPLHIFEERYRKLMADLMLPASPAGMPEAEMGVVLIEKGSEVGGGDARSRLGTVARIAGAEQTTDGRWLVVAAGTRRFQVQGWLPDDPYPLAEVEEIPDDDWSDELAPTLQTAEREVRRAVALAGELGHPVSLPAVSPDPIVASWQLCSAVPVGPFDRQVLLAAASLGERLTALIEQARDAASILAFRLGSA